MPRYTLNSGLPTYPAGLSDKDTALVLPIYRAVNNLTQQVSANIGAVQLDQSEYAQIDPFSKLLNSRTNRLIVKAATGLTYGQLVNLTESPTGTIRADIADQSLSRAAQAVVDSPAGIAAGTYGEVVFAQGRTQGIGGATLGTVYYLGVSGSVQNVAPGSGLVQRVGIGLGSGGFYFNLFG